MGVGISVSSYASIGTLTNSNTIIGYNQGVGLGTNSVITTLTNNGTISSTFSFGTNYGIYLPNTARITTLTNAGSDPSLKTRPFRAGNSVHIQLIDLFDLIA